MTVHNIPPVFDSESRILILGSFPSVKSREEAFFYAHKQNRFWKVISRAFDEPEPKTVEEKKLLLLRHKIALWDVIGSCDIKGSADSAIRNAVPNDLSLIITSAKIEKILLNGKTAEKYYRKYQRENVKTETHTLPSTSAANAMFGVDDLVVAWKASLN